MKSSNPEVEPTGSVVERLPVDTSTFIFVKTNPFLSAKLLHLRGMQTFRQLPGMSNIDTLRRDERRAYTTRRTLCRYVCGVEAALSEVLQGLPEVAKEVADAERLWRHNFPPYAEDFTEEDRQLIEAMRERSPFVDLAAGYLPQPVGRLPLIDVDMTGPYAR